MRYTLITLLFSVFIFSSVFAQQTNVALNKPVVANSENGSYPAKNAVDGKITRNSKWMSGDVLPPHILEIDLVNYCDVNKVVVHTGIPESERTPAESNQAAGFWSAKNFKIQYWDDANWTDISGTEVHENRLTEIVFPFSTAINTFKIRFVSDDGEPISIMEIEVFGTETNRVAAGGASDLQKNEERTEDQELAIKVENNVVGNSMKYVAYNQGYYMPGSNVSGWIEYSNVNSLRIWTALNSYAPLKAFKVDATIKDVQEFDKYKDELRSNPENNRFINWKMLQDVYANPEVGSTNPMILNYVLSELKRLKVDPIFQVNSRDFDNTWTNKWQQWQRYYALAYHAAKYGDATMFAMQNEPNHRHSGPMSLDLWVNSMQIVSDALRCAIEDVNKKYGKNLKARMLGPVTAGNNTEWWAEVSKNLRTDYHGNPMSEDLLGIFSTHSYNSPASGYDDRVNTIRKIISDNHPQGKSLPIVYTEIGRWMNAYLIDKEETLDSPSLFTEWAGIYTSNTKNNAYGIWAFKFANTTSVVYKSGVKSGHHYTWQGKRIVEDAYTNLAENKRVTTSNKSASHLANLIVDADKSNASTWYSDSTDTQKWIEIDLGATKTLGSAVIYTGSSEGVYTAPDRVRSFSLQYYSDNKWKDLPNFDQKDNKYAQYFSTFKKPVTTSKIRFVTDDSGIVKVREIKVFAKGDGPNEKEENYDISGIQRTGHVVRLFAKGFKDERPIFESIASVKDKNLDVLTSYDEHSGNYYMWLVQRGGYTNNLSIDLSALNVMPGTPISAETVSGNSFGDVTQVIQLADNKQFEFNLTPQSVVLLTIPKEVVSKLSINASEAATVTKDMAKSKNAIENKSLYVELDASKPSNNKVGYIYFDLSEKPVGNAQKVLLDINGHVNMGDEAFRVHVYGIPSSKWNAKDLTWDNALLLDKKEALIKEVGQKAFIAGELGLTKESNQYMLDVTDLVNKHADKGITFVLVRETRQLGDDADKGRTAIVDSIESKDGPKLHFWKSDNL